MPLKNSSSIHPRFSKSSLKRSIRFCGIFSKFKTIFLHIVLLKCQIAFLKFTSCDNQALFSRVYSNSCCSCSFEREIIKIGQSSHKMYSNKILNFQESTTILNALTKENSAPFFLSYSPIQIKNISLALTQTRKSNSSVSLWISFLKFKMAAGFFFK